MLIKNAFLEKTWAAHKKTLNTQRLKLELRNFWEHDVKDFYQNLDLILEVKVNQGTVISSTPSQPQEVDLIGEVASRK